MDNNWLLPSLDRLIQVAKEANRPKNAAEAKFYDEYRAIGYRIYRGGWPDYLCINRHNSLVCAVEVKPDASPFASCAMTPNQQLILKVLASHGIRSENWAPNGVNVVSILSNAPDDCV